MLAIFENLGFIELMVVLVAALLIFGRRLPEVAGQAGSTLARFKRSIETMREETGIEREIRKAQRDIQGVIPRDLSIGEMARRASAELEKRIKANEALDATEVSGVTQPADATSAAPTAHAEPADPAPFDDPGLVAAPRPGAATADDLDAAPPPERPAS